MPYVYIYIHDFFSKISIDMICANGHQRLLEEFLKIIEEKFTKEKENVINHKNCDGNTPLRRVLLIKK